MLISMQDDINSRQRKYKVVGFANLHHAAPSNRRVFYKPFKPDAGFGTYDLLFIGLRIATCD
jgi:hypothetical protein